MPKKNSTIKKSTEADVQDPDHGERKSTDNSSQSSPGYHPEKDSDPPDSKPPKPLMTRSEQYAYYQRGGHKPNYEDQKTSGVTHRGGRKSIDNPNQPSRDYHAGGDSTMMTPTPMPNRWMTGSKQDPYRSGEFTRNQRVDFLSPESKVREMSENLKPKDDSVTQLSFVLILIAVLSCIVVVYLLIQAPTANSPTIPTRFDLYFEQLKKMQSKYKNQTKRFWVTFHSSLEPILTSDDPDLPAVIMMAVPEDHHSMGLCFAQHVGEVIDKILDGTNSASYVDGSKYSSLDADEQKVKIDEDIQKIVESEQRTVIVSGLEKIDPKAILLFHGYCDNSEAVFKNIAIIFLLKVPAESNYSRDEEVHAFLFKLWTVLGPAKTKALLARMANNVAIMQKSSHFIC